jgi:hypothetical protein
MSKQALKHVRDNLCWDMCSACGSNMAQQEVN